MLALSGPASMCLAPGPLRKKYAIKVASWPEREREGTPMTPISRRRLLGTAAGAAAATAMLRSAYAQSPVVLRVSTSATVDENSAHHLWFQKFAANVKDTLGDRVRFDYFPNSQLGKEADIVEQVKIGSTDLMITGSSIWATVWFAWNSTAK